MPSFRKQFTTGLSVSELSLLILVFTVLYSGSLLLTLCSEVNAAQSSFEIKSVGSAPFGIAHDPVHERMYVTNFGSQGTVSVIDTKTNTVQGTPVQVGKAPFGIAHDPVHERMYVTNFGSQGTVSVIDTNTNSIIGQPIEVGSSPQGIAYDPVNKRMYVTLQANNSVSEIDTNTSKVIDQPIKVNGSPQGIAYDPVNERIYVSVFGTDGTVSAIDTKTNSIMGPPLLVGGIPQGIAYDPIHERMYVANFGSNTVQAIDTNTSSIVDSSMGVVGAYDIAYDKTNGRMYVTNIVEDLVHMIDTTTNKVIGSPINVGNSPKGISYDPVNGRMYVTNDHLTSVSAIQLASQETVITSSEDGEGRKIDNGSSTTSDSITFTLTASNNERASQRYVCLLDSFASSNCTSPLSYANLSRGDMHSFEVRAVDEYGNEGVSLTKLTWQIMPDKDPQTDFPETVCIGQNDFSKELVDSDSIYSQYGGSGSSLTGDVDMDSENDMCYKENSRNGSKDTLIRSGNIGNGGTNESGQKLDDSDFDGETKEDTFKIGDSRLETNISNCDSTEDPMLLLHAEIGEVFTECSVQDKHLNQNHQGDSAEILPTKNSMIQHSELQSSDTSMPGLPLPLPR
jgi:YVTN family beta-propeller protein